MILAFLPATIGMLILSAMILVLSPFWVAVLMIKPKLAAGIQENIMSAITRHMMRAMLSAPKPSVIA